MLPTLKRTDDWVRVTGVLTKRARALAFVSVVCGIDDDSDQHRLIAHSLLAKAVVPG